MKKKLFSLMMAVMMFSTVLGQQPVIAAKKPKLATSSKSFVLLEKKTKKLTVKNKGKAKIVYRSKNKKIAKVNKSGKVTGVKKGSTQIMLYVTKSGKKTKLVAKVKVVKKAKKLKLTNSKNEALTELSLSKGSKTTLKAKKSPSSSNDTITWSTSNKEIATVSSKGVVKALKKGTCKITAKGKYSKTKQSISLTVTGQNLASLKQTYANDFLIGAALNTYQFNDAEAAEIITEQFDSMTMENSMKPESLLDRVATVALKSNTEVAINTETLENVLSTAKKYNMKLRGHCLVWHSQTPSWFFKENYTGNKDVSKDVMTARMENYIKTVMTYCQTKYPGVVYAWDVVNEAMSDGGGDANGYRNAGSNWYAIYQDGSFIEKAFEFAAKYRAEGVKLFYNDYNEYAPAKRDHIYNMAKNLYDKGYLDGIGMQSHYSMDYPNTELVEAAIKKYASIGPNLEIQLTELDIHNTDNTTEGNQKLATKYGDLFKMLVRLDRAKEANITGVTFWGLTDDSSWLTNFKGETSYPLLFDENLIAKAAFNAVIDAAKIQG